MLHRDAEELPLCDQDDQSGHDRERPLADHQTAQRDPRQHDPGEERRGHVAFALVRTASIEIGPHLDRCRLLPARAAEPLGADDHRPRHAVVFVEVGQDVVLDLAAVDVGEQVVPRRSRSGRHADDVLARLVLQRIVRLDRTREVLGRGFDVFGRRDLVVVHRALVRAVPCRGIGDVEQIALIDHGRRHLVLGERFVDGVNVLHRLAHQFVDGLQHAGVVPGVVVVIIVVDRGGRRADRHIRFVGDHDRLTLRGTNGDVLLLRRVGCGRRFLRLPVDIADGCEELVEVLEQIVATWLVVCH